MSSIDPHRKEIGFNPSTPMQSSSQILSGTHSKLPKIVKVGDELFSSLQERAASLEVELSQEFIKLKVQAKFFAGRSHYDDREIKYLKETWLIENGPQKMYDYFNGKVLLGREDSLKDFYNTPCIMPLKS